jgi:hypothetical protein
MNTTTTDGTHPANAPPAAASRHTMLDTALEQRQAFDIAQGALAEMSGGTPQRVTSVLIHLGARLGLPTSAVGNFFLACLAARDVDQPTRDLVRRVVAAAAPAGPHIPFTAAEHVDRRDVEPGNPMPGHAEAPPADGRPGIAFRGELDIATRPALEAEVRSRVTFSDLPLMLDLRDLSFCDIAGVRALSTIHAHITHGGGTLTVRPPTALSSRRMLHLAVAHGWLPAEFAHVAELRQAAQ